MTTSRKNRSASWGCGKDGGEHVSAKHIQRRPSQSQQQRTRRWTLTPVDSKPSLMRRGSSGAPDRRGSAPDRRSSAPVRRGSGWSLAGLLGKDNDNGSKHGIGDDKSTMTAHDSLSSMFEEEDMWKEFKAELETSKVHTSAGVQVSKSTYIMISRRMYPILSF